MKITVPAHKCYKYEEVWEVVEFKDGCIYKTEPLGFVVAIDDPDYDRIDRSRYTLATINAKPGKEYVLELYKAQKIAN
ncbi:MAG: hypothetical protein WC444_06190 [Candidatus Paceibacterota bacterium]